MSKRGQPAKVAQETPVEPEVQETPTKPVAPEKPAKTEPLMYVGPTITGIGIQNRVYTEIPAGAAEAIAKDPELGNLFIPVREYPKANKMLRERTGYIFSAFTKALKLKK